MNEKRTFIVVAVLIALSISSAAVAQRSSAPTLDELAALAERGDQEAQIALGMRYRDGKGVARD